VAYLPAKRCLRASATGPACEGLRDRPYASCYVRAVSRLSIRSAQAANVPMQGFLGYAMTSVMGPRQASIRYLTLCHADRPAELSLDAPDAFGATRSATEILEDGFSVATREGPTANTAGYPTINNFRSGLDCDDVIKRVAI
jgi:hypothetical protein